SRPSCRPLTPSPPAPCAPSTTHCGEVSNSTSESTERLLSTRWAPHPSHQALQRNGKYEFLTQAVFRQDSIGGDETACTRSFQQHRREGKLDPIPRTVESRDPGIGRGSVFVHADVKRCEIRAQLEVLVEDSRSR